MLSHPVFTERKNIEGSPSENFFKQRIFPIKIKVALVAKTVKRYISTSSGLSSPKLGSIMGFLGMPHLLVTILVTGHQYL